MSECVLPAELAVGMGDCSVRCQQSWREGGVIGVFVPSAELTEEVCVYAVMIGLGQA